MDVVIAGSSGLIGTALTAALSSAGHNPIRLVRRAPAPGADEIQWDPATGALDGGALEGIDAVVNLNGAGIGSKRWSEAYRATLVESRTGSTSLLASTLAGLNVPPKVFLSGSAIGIYGSQGPAILEESAPAADDFLASLCVRWEGAAQSAIDAGIRTVLLRTGIVQSTNGGALPKMLPLFKLFLGGKFGDGSQYISWIHIDDIVDAMVFLLTSDVSGPVNLTAPTPVTNADYTAALGATLGRPTFATVPPIGPRLLLGTDMANALLFDSIRAVPSKLQAAGFDFTYTDIEQTLANLTGAHT